MGAVIPGHDAARAGQEVAPQKAQDHLAVGRIRVVDEEGHEPVLLTPLSLLFAVRLYLGWVGQSSGGERRRTEDEGRMTNGRYWLLLGRSGRDKIGGRVLRMSSRRLRKVSVVREHPCGRMSEERLISVRAFAADAVP